MWLLNAETRHLEHFADDERVYGNYAILSHTWEHDEVTFDDVQNGRAEGKSGYRKIDLTCLQALEDDLQYVWVDTCCIDKRSSAELSEAINSMYRWYYNAHVCYAYLSDVTCDSAESPEDVAYPRFARMRDEVRRARWFTRGWTLQELLAPRVVEFHDSNWLQLGARHQVVDTLSEITRISPAFLRDRDKVQSASIAQKMSWASLRVTTRLEDQAYSLLGIFDVNLPLLYGEGSKAFLRLQEEIIRTQGDHSILVWYSHHRKLLAPSPAAFSECDRIVRQSITHEDTFELTSKGLRVSVLARPNVSRGQGIVVNDGGATTQSESMDDLLVALSCGYDDFYGKRIALRLQRRPRVFTHQRNHGTQQDMVYDRLPEITAVTERELTHFTPMEVIIAKTPLQIPSISGRIISVSHGGSAKVEKLFPRGSSTVFHEERILLPLNDGGASGQFGHMMVSHSVDGTVSSLPRVVLSVMLVSDRGIPELFMEARDEDQVLTLSSLPFGEPSIRLQQGQRRTVTVSESWQLQVAVRYVLSGGETLWHLDLTGQLISTDLPQAVSTLDETQLISAVAEGNAAFPGLQQGHLPLQSSQHAQLLEFWRRMSLFIAALLAWCLQTPLLLLASCTYALGRFLSTSGLRPHISLQHTTSYLSDRLKALSIKLRISQSSHIFGGELPGHNEIFEMEDTSLRCELPGERPFELPAQGKWALLRVDTAALVEADKGKPEMIYPASATLPTTDPLIRDFAVNPPWSEVCGYRGWVSWPYEQEWALAFPASGSEAMHPASAPVPTTSSLTLAHNDEERSASSLVQEYRDLVLSPYEQALPEGPHESELMSAALQLGSEGSLNEGISLDGNRTPDLTSGSDSPFSEHELIEDEEIVTDYYGVRRGSILCTPAEWYSPDADDMHDLLAAL
ncbi:hypothetical protein PRZ48_003868 [Zasmidium cellare]|uniref:Heterokaryon incompatibility domain-containing protein n=1 Tax=Zasmidium cellare TaxID=395010 RepID=A0ABR0EXV1_ZASCE|nr:hypothetical protein PRZ48_003868 [Zasmidium cellare]